ncbi:MAG TPA: MFS transporter [Solirubrobacteraceae bacterium]|nr:MFS transporter [Solirubrobacteraceae bacterium]
MTTRIKSPASTNALVALVCLAQFMVILDVSIVNVALPSIRAGLGFSGTALQWVVTAYTITFAGFLLLGGRAGDLIGRRPVFLTGTVAFALCSLICALSDSQTTLLIARALQGLAGALLSPATLSIITAATPEGPQRTRALGIWGAVGGLGASSGAILGGLLTQTLGWQAIFAINVPIGAVVMLGALRLVPAIGPRDVEAERHFDLSGALLSTAGLLLLAYAVTRSSVQGWGSAGVLAPLIASSFVVSAFLYVEARVATAPLMPLSIFRIPQLRWANLAVLLLYAGAFSMFYFMTLFLQQVEHMDALGAGAAFLPTTLSVFFGSTRAPKLLGHFGLAATVAGGLAITTAGLAYLSLITAGAQYLPNVLPGMILVGLGMGTTLVAGTVAATRGVPAAETGLASGLLNTARLMGGALGLAVLSTIADSATRADRGVPVASALTHGYAVGLAAGAGFTFTGALVAALLLGRLGRRRSALDTASESLPVSMPDPRATQAAERDSLAA